MANSIFGNPTPTVVTDDSVLKGVVQDNGGQVFNVKVHGAKGDTNTDDTAAIQAAIDAAIALIATTGTTASVYLPPGTYRISSTLVLSRGMTLEGAGPATTTLAVDASMDANTDVLALRPTSDGGYYILRGFAINARTSTAGRHAIRIDGVHALVSYSHIEHLKIGATHGSSISGVGNGAGSISLAWSSIENNYLGGPITIDACGDHVRIIGNTISGSGTVDVNNVAGSSTLVFQGNSFINDGGVHVGAVVGLQFVENEVETLATFTGSNGATLDVDGSASVRANDVMVARNSFQVVNNITANAIRLNRTDRVTIYGNRFGRGATTSVDVVVVSGVTDVCIGSNLWATTGSPLVTDAGTRTSMVGATTGVTTAAAVLDATRYLNLVVSGVTYKLALVQ